MSRFEQNTQAASPMATPSLHPSTAKSPRVLACVLCQQRKVKCDRHFPCGNCVKSNKQCLPAATLAPRQRRQRFPERELLDRLRNYESLLRQNKIEFEPLHTHGSAEQKPPRNEGSSDREDSPDDQRRAAVGAANRPSSLSKTSKSETVYKAKNLWHALNQRQSRDSDDDSSDSSSGHVLATVVKKAWKQSYQSSDHLLFGTRKTDIDLSILHPEQVQIFRLWQIYLDNINPLLKVTHTPTLQGRIIDAASNVASIKPSLAALMFSIYGVSILSLDEDQCHSMFASPREDLLRRYQFGCQQALLDCGFLRSNDRECLTALYLYLISVRSGTDPQSLSSLLGLVIRIAQRMGLHSESVNAKRPALEAEMRRRLWWSIVLFDTRICELADNESVTLVPTWDCKTPLNVNDFDLQPGLKDPPVLQGKSSEALFAVVRSEMGDFARHSAFHLDFTVPALKTVAKNVQNSPNPESGELVILKKMIEEEYLELCNLGNPLHFMTIWTARGQLARNRLIESFSKSLEPPIQRTDSQHDAAISHAQEMLECDTKLMTSPLIKGYLWLLQLYFPFPAYIHIVQDLRRRPAADHAGSSWKTMSNNYEARFMPLGQTDNPFFKIFAKNVLQAWEAREASFNLPEMAQEPPLIVSDIRQKIVASNQIAAKANGEQPRDIFGTSIDNTSISLPMDFGGHGMLYSLGGQGFEGLGTEPGESALGMDAEQLDWTMIDWTSVHARGW